ncbi:DUF2490 domain-containing protein [Ferruginibacter sp.]|nr:DUF2490 domain-containing protein [Ferruginibacter sp.]
MKAYLKLLLLAAAQLYCTITFGQATQKQIFRNNYTWISINSNLFLNKHWFIMADAHLRENDFFASRSFIFGRVGLGYQINNNLSAAAGYGNLLQAPSTPGWVTDADESRIFEQLQLTTSYGKLKLLQRLRIEQRWQQKIINDQKTGDNKYTNRFRYLLSATLPVFKKSTLPQFTLSDELLLQSGAAVVYNPFDQNRIFIGIKQKINNTLSFDAGYMRIFQQRNNGGSYTLSNTYRLFFYYTLPVKKHNNS